MRHGATLALAALANASSVRRCELKKGKIPSETKEDPRLLLKLNFIVSKFKQNVYVLPSIFKNI